MMRIAREIGIKVEAQSDTHTKTNWMRMVMEHVRSRRTSSLGSSSRMSAGITPI